MVLVLWILNWQLSTIPTAAVSQLHGSTSEMNVKMLTLVTTYKSKKQSRNFNWIILSLLELQLKSV